MITSRIFLVGTFFLVFFGAVAHNFAQDELVELVTTLLGDEDKDVRALAFDQIRNEAKGGATTQKFAELLPKFPAETQVGLLSALADRKDAAAAPAVRELLAATDNEAVRVAAVEALGFLGNQEDLQVLVPAMSSESANMRAAAEASLVRLPNEATAAMVVEMKALPPPARITLIQILTKRRAREAVPALLESARGSEVTVRLAAINALAELAEIENLADMLPLVLSAADGRERDEAEKAIANICQRNAEQQDRAAPLIAVWKQTQESEQVVLLPTLGRVGGPSPLAIVDAAFASSQAELHAAAIRAYANWPDGAVVSRLLRIARTNENAAERKSALQALIRITPLADERTDQLRLDTLRTVFVMCSSAAEQNQLLDRAKAIRTIETLRYLVPLLQQPPFMQQACLTIVELAHHSALREANKDEFHQVLDQVIRLSTDPVVVDRAKRYKAGQTWVRPKSST